MPADPDVSDLLSVPQALHILDTFPLTPRPTTVPLSRALNHILAQDLHADRDYPPFDKSQMDGYALRAADATTPPFTLPITQEILPGATPPPLPPGYAAPIMTGAPLPQDADSIIPVEDTRQQQPGGPVTFLVPPIKGRFIAPIGSDTPNNTLLLPKGARLTPAAIAVAATIGAAEIAVYAKPKVTVFSTGDELVPVEAAPGPSQIRNSNASTVHALLARLGLCSIVRSFDDAIRDDPRVIRSTIDAILPFNDVLFISGGMSMGTHDFVPRILQELGFTPHITKLRIKPGKPFLFASRPRPASPSADPAQVGKSPIQFAFGLPGNPVSAYLCTLRLAARLLARIQGADPNPKLHRAPLAQPLPPNGPREFYQPVQLDPTGRATPLPWKGSADVFTLARAQALLIRPENAAALDAGAEVDLLPLP